MRLSPSLLLIFTAALAAPQPGEVWRFDNTAQLGGNKTTVLGHPHVIDTPFGKAVEFNGRDDALFVDVHPLAGAEAFTWEIVFHPSADGPAAQRFFHLQELDPKTGHDTQTRMLMETRLSEGAWSLDSFALSGGESKALFDAKKLHPAGRWYAVAAVYDGHEFRNYVDGVLQNRAELHLTPQGAGHSSAGARIDRRDYFKGAIREARFSRRALAPGEFLKAPGR
jgi:Concanavalin A-like lectin/glucanases superfamily